MSIFIWEISDLCKYIESDHLRNFYLARFTSPARLIPGESVLPLKLVKKTCMKLRQRFPHYAVCYPLFWIRVWQGGQMLVYPKFGPTSRGVKEIVVQTISFGLRPNH